MQFKSFLLLASLVVSSLAQATVATVQDDINNKIAPAVSNLNTTVNAFPILLGGTVDQALSLASQVSDGDGIKIISDLQNLESILLKSLTDLVARKPSLEVSLPGDVPALIKQDLTAMRTSMTNFTEALITHVPLSVRSAALSMQANVDAVWAGVSLLYGIS
ncbi:hypothetical protein C0995_008585 [Termitomyces sp. Mi166|nr:hypothetical protein C0995_008585 [Termitomyces sp. Mi166\